jgi:hypothetical protein
MRRERVADASAFTPTRARARAGGAEPSAPQPAPGLRDRLSAALSGPRTCLPRAAPGTAGEGGLAGAVPAHVRTEAAAVRDVVTESARAAAEAVKLAATTTAAELRAAATAGLIASGSAVRSCWYQVHADLTETEAEERAEREAERIGLVEVRRLHCAIASHLSPQRA